MKVPGIKFSISFIIVIFLLISAGLNIYARDDGVRKKIREAVNPAKDEVSGNLNIYLPEDIVLVEEQYQGGIFWTESRKEKVGRFKCSGCHNIEKVTVSRAAEIAHGDITLSHGSSDKPLNCFTCHNKNDRDFLKSEKHLRIDIDHSYMMCGQCHFREKKDWKGGAHGKRVDSWTGDRVVMNCTSCHDPHSPRLKKRWPETYSPPAAK